MRLFAYKMTHDTGFAPNPFWGYLTLATCKPRIREHKRPGDWVAGFTSKSLCGDRVGEERLVFLMQVEEKMALADYFHDRRFQSRIPRDQPAARVYRSGDNIYRPLVPDACDAREFKQLPNRQHGSDQKDHDLKGRNALIASRFVYFGSDPLAVPPEVRPTVPAGQSSHGTLTHDLTKAERFIEYVFRVADACVMAPPHKWPGADSTWKTHEADASDQKLSETEENSKAGSTCRWSDHSPAAERMSVCGKPTPLDNSGRSRCRPRAYAKQSP